MYKYDDKSNYKLETFKDSYKLNTTTNTLTRVNDLPKQEAFKNPSILSVNDGLYVIGDKDKEVYKYSIADDAWEYFEKRRI